jgi:hypothetical protein
MYGRIEYDEEGLPKCEICGEHYNRVLPHVRQTHKMGAKEYKVRFGFDATKGICSKESSEKTRVKTLSNFNTVVKNNLIEKGFNNRFKNGDKGRTKDKVSEQTRIALKERLKEDYMVEAMRESGRKVGKSGLGNIAKRNKKQESGA